jgi:hypothetical protein
MYRNQQSTEGKKGVVDEDDVPRHLATLKGSLAHELGRPLRAFHRGRKCLDSEQSCKLHLAALRGLGHELSRTREA